MKKFAIIFTCIIIALLMVSCDSVIPDGNPDEKKDYDEVHSKLEGIESSSDKSEIEKNIKDLFGVSISLPSGSEYQAETLDLDSASSYIVMIKGTSVTAEDYFNSVKSKFNGWEMPETGELALGYEADKVVYGFAVENTDGYFGLVFTMTDKELVDQFVSKDDEFVNEIKTHSGVTLTLPECVKSIGLPGLSNNGAKVSYGGMLLNDNGSINKEEFDQFVSSVDSQLSGYTKSVEGEDDDMTVKWTNNSDPSKYFEAAYYEFDGTPMTSFSYNYLDKSLLAPWPTDDINELIGTNAGVPEYDGLYDDITVENHEDYEDDNSISIYLEGISEEEFNAYFALLETQGFTKMGGESEYSKPYWSKSISDTLYVEMKGSYSESYWGDGGNGSISIYKTVLENVYWPADEIAAQFGDKAAGKIPSVASAQRRTFEVYDDDYSYIYVSGTVDEQLFTSYCASIEALGFTLEEEWGQSKEYLYQWDDYDRLTVGVSYTSADDAGQEYMQVSIKYKPYESFVTLPANVQITHTANNYYSSTPVTETITKIGEDWYFSGTYGTSYYKYNSADRTWNVYNGYKLGSTGAMTWLKDSKSYDRYAVDSKLKSALSGVYVERLIEDADEFTKGSTVTLHGQSCVEYSESMNFGNSYGTSTVYYFNESMSIAFKMTSTVVSGGEERTSTWEITDFNTSVSSFEGAGITADMLPSE